MLASRPPLLQPATSSRTSGTNTRAGDPDHSLVCTRRLLTRRKTQLAGNQPVPVPEAQAITCGNLTDPSWRGKGNAWRFGASPTAMAEPQQVRLACHVIRRAHQPDRPPV